MGRAKDIIIKPISAKIANAMVKKNHYSGKVVPNSQLHFGCFLDNKLEGVLQFGPSMRKDLIISLVGGTGWNEFIELNRMGFSDTLPRNSESRAISIALKLIKKQYLHIKWVISFADATQCGDGAIYRASGFVLTGIKKNNQMRINPATGKPIQSMAAFHNCKSREFKNWKKLEGFQLRYIYFIDKSCRKKLTVPEIPFSKVDEMGAGMYKGVKRSKQAMGSTTATAEGQNLPGRSKEKEEVV